MYKISFSPEAVDDLKEIKQYIKDELCNEQAAKNTVAKILKKVKMLSDFPESGSSLSAIIGFDTDYRYLVCDNYIAFYRIENKNVLMVRILYGKRNYMLILFGDIS
ncbi:MAG: type II toxin-antitoxin system RelE/ParE family toxin [Oscillospiraceae bacterium]|nr:type II toxin-antitoxin system RelE/ParE family toxin [Oscillospiraceae bacterium]MBQ3237119.1 type II toxin-antitoxin system RelE/ParE family toxin [Oscillospiraceae bacterium]